MDRNGKRRIDFQPGDKTMSQRQILCIFVGAFTFLASFDEVEAGRRCFLRCRSACSDTGYSLSGPPKETMYQYYALDVTCVDAHGMTVASHPEIYGAADPDDAQALRNLHEKI